MMTSVTRLCFATQHQTCKTKTIVYKTKTNFFGFKTGLVLIPTVSDHITDQIVSVIMLGMNPAVVAQSILKLFLELGLATHYYVVLMVIPAKICAPFKQQLTFLQRG